MLRIGQRFGLAGLAGLVWIVTGCTTPDITNLTPSQYSRSPDGLYRFEADLESRQKAMKKETIDAYVVVDTDNYPMKRTEMVEGRWETMVPIPDDQDRVIYHFKFDYLYDAIPSPRQESLTSRPYLLRIRDE